jgi:TolA-binding protein
MKQQNFLFIVFCLVLSFGLLQSFHIFRDHFSDEKELKNQLTVMNEKLAREQLKLATTQGDLVELRNEVAKTLPQTIIAKNEKLKNLSAQTRMPASDQKIELSGTYLEEARASFRRGDYKNASQVLKQMIEKFPASPHLIEAHFLLSESLFLQGRQQESLEVTNQMMNQFPESPLTGFILFRMGQILESRNREEEAKEVYRVIKRSFASESQLVNQADKMIKSLEEKE